MVKLGVSVYPEQESFEELSAYLERAAQAGFTKVFTSMFSVDEDAAALSGRFGRLAARVHELGMELAVDANPMLFERLGATAGNLEPFARIGVDVLRMDMPFFDERTQALIDNPYGIGIEFSAMMGEALERVLTPDQIARVGVSHNFYPQRFTGECLAAYQRMNAFWKACGAHTGAFVSSQNAEARGPWPVKDGLPTVEDHRDLPLDLEIRHLLLLGDIDEIMIGNEPATSEELAEVGRVVRRIAGDADDAARAGFGAGSARASAAGAPSAAAPRQTDGLAALFGARGRTLLHVELDGDITATERAICLEYASHADMGDGTDYMLRSRMTRMVYRDAEIPARPYEDASFRRGDIVIVNDNLKHYRAELQIVLRDMPNDGQRNHVGRVAPEEMILLDAIQPQTVFLLEEA